MGRPKKIYEKEDLLRAAHLFHERKWSKTVIARELAPLTKSIRDVTALLAQAKARGLVKIQVLHTPENVLELAIQERYRHVKRVMIVPGPEATTPVECNDLFHHFGRKAADYFLREYEAHGYVKPWHVGVTGGARLLAFANAVPTLNRGNVRIHAAALVGRGKLRDATSHIEPSVVASILWTHCGSFAGSCEYHTVEPYFIKGAPGRAARISLDLELKRLEKIPSIKQVIQDMDHLDIVFAGFGFMNAPEASEEMQNRITMGSLLESVVTQKTLANEGAVGDFCYCPYDANGKSKDEWRFFLTAGHFSKHKGIEFFRDMVKRNRTVVGFGGPYLFPAIKAALEGKIVNVLIIDSHTASRLAEGG